MSSDPDPTLVLTEDERAERARIVAALSDVNHNATRLAVRLGMSRRSLMEKIQRYRIPRPPPTEAQLAFIQKYGMPRDRTKE
jgi:DNA-binding NtrC family response regulator